MDKKYHKKRQAILDRIRHIEEAITKAKEYLENGKHANWQGFKPIFTEKLKNNKPLPPHKDWVKNFFIPSAEKALIKAENKLDKLN